MSIHRALGTKLPMTPKQDPGRSVAVRMRLLGGGQQCFARGQLQVGAGLTQQFCHRSRKLDHRAPGTKLPMTPKQDPGRSVAVRMWWVADSSSSPAANSKLERDPHSNFVPTGLGVISEREVVTQLMSYPHIVF